MMINQIGQPAASMMDSTCGKLLGEIRTHFSPRSAIPQGLVRLGADRHKAPREAFEAMALSSGTSRGPRTRALRIAFQRFECMQFVGRSEVSSDNATNVANHPQSLWISLWAAFRGMRQVGHRKGFFFFRSNFERRAF
jgi:hypothetical protein